MSDRPIEKTRVFLKSLKSDKGIYNSTGRLELTFDLVHDNTNSTLDQELWLIEDNGLWKASIGIEEFPKQNTAQEAAAKLSDWLKRLSKAIDNGISESKFTTIDINNL